MRLILLGLYFAMAGTVAAAPTDWHEQVRSFAKGHFRNPAWGYSHNERDYALARALAAADHVTLDDDVLFAAAFLHDLAAFAPWADDKRDHSDVAAEQIGTILKDTGFPLQKLDAVRGAIRTHMYYRDPQGPEALYLHDADALDWLGAIGVARVFGLADANGGTPDGPTVLQMLLKNRKEVPPHVVSSAGRARLPEMSAELDRYLRALKTETDGFKTL